LRNMYQGGFRPARGTSEQVFVLNHLAEAAQQQQAPLYLWTSGRRLTPCATNTCGSSWTPTASPAPSKPAYARCTPSLRWLSTSTGSTRTSFVRVLVGVRQGDRPSPTLFGLFIEVLEQYIKRAVGPEWQGKVPAVLHTHGGQSAC
jgi:hypothetical protein